MKYELTQDFYFDAAHSLSRELDTDSSRRVHGHTYYAEISIQGPKDPRTGMVVDLGHLKRVLESVRWELDHRLLDEVEGLGAPTIENLCTFILNRIQKTLPTVCRVTVRRKASGDSCTLTIEHQI